MVNKELTTFSDAIKRCKNLACSRRHEADKLLLLLIEMFYFSSFVVALHFVDSVRDVSFRPLKDVYKVGEVIHCSVMGQPAAEVVISSTGRIPQSVEAAAGHGAVVIPDQWLGKIIGLNCSGKNVINGKIYTISSEHTFNVTGWHLISRKQMFCNYYITLLLITILIFLVE